MDKFSEVADSLCVGQRINGDEERVVLFLKMSNSHKFEERLVNKVKAAIRKELSARHVPALVLEISDIPVSNRTSSSSGISNSSSSRCW